MDICEGLYSYLSNINDIKDKIGNRLYPEVIPENAKLPAIMYSPVLANYDSALGGDTGFVKQTIQIVCHDKTFKKARELSRLVKNALQDFHGNMGGVNIEAVFIKTDYELSGFHTTKLDLENYMSSIEFDFYYNE